jgi:hypothetical protein
MPVLPFEDRSPPELVAYGSLAGWWTLWLKYASGFNPSCHCQRCLIGDTERSLARRLSPGRPMPLMTADRVRFDALYLCGVHASGDWSKNLHLVAIPDPDGVAEVRASTGTLFRITGARRVEIPDLPLGYDGRGKDFTTCRNWRFGVAYYGLSPERGAFDRRRSREGNAQSDQRCATGGLK